MRQGLLTRDQVIARVGDGVVCALDRINCEMTNRVGYNGSCQDNDYTEWAASMDTVDLSGEDITVVAYYYTNNEQDQIMADNDGDGSSITWEIEGYEII